MSPGKFDIRCSPELVLATTTLFDHELAFHLAVTQTAVLATLKLVFAGLVDINLYRSRFIGFKRNTAVLEILQFKAMLFVSRLKMNPDHRVYRALDDTWSKFILLGRNLDLLDR